jgi:hypothetical protein
MKGRSLAALLARVDEWHRDLNRERTGVATPVQWVASGIGEYTFEEKYGGETLTWRIAELTTAKALSAEGSAMCHCVATYGPSCAHGAVSVWSLTVSEGIRGDPTRVMTIAVNRNRFITEARGKRNALPTERIAEVGTRITPADARLLSRGRRVVQQWAKGEKITLPHYLT